MITFTELVDEMLRSTSRRRRNNKSRGQSRKRPEQAQDKDSNRQTMQSDGANGRESSPNA
jgi:hypothetical protein